MADLLTFIEQEKKKMLAQLESELQGKSGRALADLEKKATSLAAELQKKREMLKTQLRSQKEYELSAGKRFELLGLKRKAVQGVWQSATQKHFASAEQCERWLKQCLTELPSSQASLSAGPSQAVLEKLVKTMSLDHLTVKQDVTLKEEGFLYHSTSVQADFRLSAYLAERFRAAEVAINRVLFGQND